MGLCCVYTSFSKPVPLKETYEKETVNYNAFDKHFCKKSKLQKHMKMSIFLCYMWKIVLMPAPLKMTCIKEANCAVCDKEFSNKSQVKIHMKKEHVLVRPD